jgi:hypothetical protein
MKTYTAEEFEIEFYRAMNEWLQGGKVGIDPRENWEFLNNEDEWRNTRVSPAFNPCVTYRWKPAPKRTVIIDGVELVAPETVAPKVGTRYFIRDCYPISEMRWNGNPTEALWLQDGFIFLTPEDAKAMYEAQRKQRLGGAA